MGFDGKHRTAIPLPERRQLSGKRCGFVQGHQNALTASQASERAVVDPIDVNPERVHQGPGVLVGLSVDRDRHSGLGGSTSFHDVSHPVAIASGRLIGVVADDPRGDVQVRQIGGAQQHRRNGEFGDKDLHPWMGIGDLENSGDLQTVTVSFNGPLLAAKLEWGGRPQPVSQLQPAHAEAEGEGSGRQKHAVRSHKHAAA